MAKHTPGPWQLGKSGFCTNEGQVAVMDGEGEYRRRIALVDFRDDSAPKKKRWELPCEERDANARLIAAAPQMLEALKAIVAEADQSNGGKGARLPFVLFLRDIADAAIKLAEAE